MKSMVIRKIKIGVSDMETWKCCPLVQLGIGPMLTNFRTNNKRVKLIRFYSFLLHPFLFIKSTCRILKNNMMFIKTMMANAVAKKKKEKEKYKKIQRELTLQKIYLPMLPVVYAKKGTWSRWTTSHRVIHPNVSIRNIKKVPTGTIQIRLRFCKKYFWRIISKSSLPTFTKLLSR